jgi:hypothetical protein
LDRLASILLLRRTKLFFAGLAIVAAIMLLAHDRTIAQGTGLIVSTLAAGAGWLLREYHDERRSVRNICQAYTAMMEAQFRSIALALSDSELDRFLALAATIRADPHQAAIGSKTADPFKDLPDLRPHLYAMRPLTVKYLQRWRLLTEEMYFIYDSLGTVETSRYDEVRLAAWFEWVKTYRNQYRDVAYTAVCCLLEEAPEIQVELTAFLNAKAERIG